MQRTFEPQAIRGSGFSARRSSPAALGAAIGVHVVIIGAVVMMPGVAFKPIFEPALPTRNIPLPPDPPKQADPAEQKPEMQQPSQNARPKQPDVPQDPANETHFPETKGADDTGSGTGVKPLDPPVHIPVLIDARPDPTRLRDFQPEYPGAMVRAEMEGKVTVRVRISALGRVESIDLVEATDPAFWRATREHALRYWRFRPATRDGVAIPTDRVMTVRFTLSDRG